MRTWLLCAALTTLPAFSAPTEITMGFNPAENVEVVETNGKLFSDFFHKKTGIKVKTFIATDYTALIEALRSGRIDFAWLPPFSFIKAEKMAGAQVLLKSVRKGKAEYFSAIVVRSDKKINDVKDLKGKTIAWVDPTSTSGHIMPKADLMRKHNLDPDTYFSRQIFAGGHDAAVLAVVNGTVDSAATFSNDKKGTDGSWTQFLKGEDQKKVKVVFVTDAIPGDSMAVSKKFLAANKAIVDSTVSILKEMGGNEEGKKILMALYRIESMVPAESRDYDPVRNAAEKLKID